MKTIGAKELRLHLDEILDRVNNGEEVIIKHRFKEPVKLSPVRSGAKAIASKLPPHVVGLEAFLKAPRRPAPFDPEKSFKELYHEGLEKKYGA